MKRSRVALDVPLVAARTNSGRSGRGPTKLMSPRSTFQSCGSSSSRVARRSTRRAASRADRPRSPAPGPCRLSASSCIVRNLKIVNGEPSAPDARLPVDHRPARREAHGERDQQHDRQRHHEEHARRARRRTPASRRSPHRRGSSCSTSISGMSCRRRRLAPADQDLERRRHDRHARAHAVVAAERVEQLVLPRRIGRDDHLVDVVALAERRQVLAPPEHRHAGQRVGPRAVAAAHRDADDVEPSHCCARMASITSAAAAFVPTTSTRRRG